LDVAMSDSQGEAVRYSELNGANHLLLHGVVDLFAAAELRELALQCAESGRATCVDCRGLERIDGSILQLMLALERDHRERAAELSLLAVPDNVSRYLRLAGAQSLLAAAREMPTFAPDPDAAADAGAAVAAPTDPDGPPPREG
jgi:anti-anti-sigma factor